MKGKEEEAGGGGRRVIRSSSVAKERQDDSPAADRDPKVAVLFKGAKELHQRNLLRV